MKSTLNKFVLPSLFLSAAFITVVPGLIRAQYPGPYGAPPWTQAPTTPSAQRNALSAVREIGRAHV